VCSVEIKNNRKVKMKITIKSRRNSRVAKRSLFAQKIRRIAAGGGMLVLIFGMVVQFVVPNVNADVPAPPTVVGGDETPMLASFTPPSGTITNGQNVTFTGVVNNDFDGSNGSITSCVLSSWKNGDYDDTITDKAAIVNGNNITGTGVAKYGYLYIFRCNPDEMDYSYWGNLKAYLDPSSKTFVDFDTYNGSKSVGNFEGTYVGNNKVEFTWTVPSDTANISGYSISSGCSSNPVTVNGATTTNTEVTITPSYYCQLGDNVWFNIETISLDSGTIGSAGGSVALAQSLPAGSLITSVVTWPSGRLAAGNSYPVSVPVTAAATKCELVGSNGSTTELTISGGKAENASAISISTNPDYNSTTYTVKCHNADDATEQSDPWTPTNINYGPTKPTNVKAQTQANGDVVVTWTASTDSDGIGSYSVAWGTWGADGNGSYSPGGNITDTTYTIDAAKIASQNATQVRVTPYDAATPSVAGLASDAVTITPYSAGGTGTGTGDNDGDSDGSGTGTGTDTGTDTDTAKPDDAIKTTGTPTSGTTKKTAGTPGTPDTSAMLTELHSAAPILIIVGVIILAAPFLARHVRVQL
jgi:hypothetical protein